MTGLLERETELAALSDALEQAAAGRGELVLIEGAAGIGKTCLLDACRDIAAQSGTTALSARADRVTMESPFAAVRELLWPSVQAGAVTLDGAARLAEPVFAETTGGTEDRAGFASVMHGLYWLVADLAESGPLLLCVDDAHWLDAASARFLVYLGNRLGSLAVLALAASRHDEGGAERELAAVAGRVLRPRPLSIEAAATLTRDRLGARAGPELSASCHQASGGNPFYLRELLDTLAEEPERPTVAAAERVRSLGVGAIARAVLVRLSRLGEECELLAEATSVLAPGSPLRHAAALARLQRDAAARAADRLRAADVFAGSTELSFAHPIVPEAVLAELTPSRLAELQTSAARILVAEGAPAETVAPHLMAAEPFGEAWVVDALRAAARRALGQGAPDLAVSYLRRALAEPPVPGERLAVLVELGDAEARLPVEQEHAALREAIELAAEPEQRAQIALRLALALFGVISSEAGRAVLDDVLRERDALSPQLAEELEAALIGGGIVDLNGAARVLAVAQRHLERARRGEISDPRMLSALAMAAAAAGLDAGEVAAMARAALSDPRLITSWLDDGYVSATAALAWADQLTEAAAAQDAGIAEAQRRGWAAMYMQLTALRAETALRAGELALAEEHGQRGVELAIELGAAPFAALPLVGTLLEHGEGARALELLDSSALSADVAATWPAAAALALTGRSHVAAGDVKAGLLEMQEADRQMAAAGLQLSVILDWAPAASGALAQLGRAHEAVELAERELAQAQAARAPRRLGMALSARGLLEPGEQGLARLGEAVDILDASPARLEHARALVNLGRRMRELGNRSDARRPLSLALDIAHRCGARALAEQARSELVAAGARPRREALSGAGALTPAESRTAKMAAAGLSNREIAQTLFLSTKTIEKHLSQAYLKLDIDGRGELAAALGRTEPGGRAGKGVGTSP